MKIFISWSGPRSKMVAEGLAEWLPTVLQHARPWISSRDIGAGAAWYNRITKELRETDKGIFCLTPENLGSGWLLFEAGAIAKGKDDNSVCSLMLAGLKPSEVGDPLGQFQATIPTVASFEKMILDFAAPLTRNWTKHCVERFVRCGLK